MASITLLAQVTGQTARLDSPSRRSPKQRLHSIKLNPVPMGTFVGETTDATYKGKVPRDLFNMEVIFKPMHARRRQNRRTEDVDSKSVANVEFNKKSERSAEVSLYMF